ncbi:MAG: hypothetical protein AB8B53_11670 [Flavobacteriales bacterium]
MKPSTELFELVKSLSKSEKRFFKLSSSLQTGEKNYLKIFDAIEKQSEYDEAALKETFKKEIFVNHFPSEKNHLYKLILKSLRNYHSDNSINSILKQEIKNVEILYNKGLFKECNKFLMRAKKQAIENEKFYFLFELISWEKLLLEEAFEDGQFNKDLDKLIDEEQDVIAKLRNLAEYHVLYSKINYVFRSEGFSRNAEDIKIVREIEDNPLIKGKNTALSKRAATICYYTQGFCAMANSQTSQALAKFKRVKDILDERPKLKEDLSKRYVKTMAKLISCNIDLGEYDEAWRIKDELKAIPGQRGFKSIDIKLNVFKISIISELQLLTRSGDFAKALVVVEDALDGLDKVEGRLRKEQLLELYYHVAYSYFGNGEFNQALFWINKVLNDNENTLRKDLFSYARLFNLVIHFELKNYDLLEYITKSTQRYLVRRQRDYELEKLVIDHLRKLIRENKSQNKKQKYETFRIELEKLIQEPEDQIVLRYFDFKAWIDSKIEDVPFSKAVSQELA